MTWDNKLIALYFWVSECFEAGAVAHAQRHCKNVSTLKLDFTDEEAITIYLFGILRKYKEVKDIYTYTNDHLIDWFPNLPSYQKFNKRLNHLNDVFAVLAQMAATSIKLPRWLVDSQDLVDSVVDSMPIILAQRGRSGSAKVAKEVANKGRCASKGLFYHGVKLHHLGLCMPGTLPKPHCLLISKASENDNTVFKEQIAPACRNLRVFSDRIYHDQKAIKELKEQFNIEVMPCQKRKKGQKHLYADQKFFSTGVSRAKQTVESFFNWINQKTGIQMASKVRSTQGLFKHIFGKLTAALLILIGF